MKKLIILSMVAILGIFAYYAIKNDRFASNEILEGYDETVKETSVDLLPATNTVVSGVNPAHGQPGHRCDIPVGSSLNSASPNPAASSILNASETKQQTLPAGKVIPGTNPPHGQPGHRCDLAVGAKLPES